MSKRSGVYGIYKNKGCAKFTQIPVRWKPHGDNHYVDKTGAVLLEVAPGVAKHEWDWTQKISFALGVADIALLLDGKTRIFHDHGGTPKVVEFSPGKDQYEGTWNLTVSEGKGEARRTIFVPFSGGEFALMMRLLVSSAPSMLGWS